MRYSRTPNRELVQSAANLPDLAKVRENFLAEDRALQDKLMRQDDVRVIAIKDYIEHPKESGYRSYHMIIEIPVFFSDET